MKKAIKAISNKCKKCGDEIVFDPDKFAAVCKSCKNSIAIEQNLQFEKHNVDSSSILTDNNASWASQIKTMVCPNCGANSMLNKYEATTLCHYCNSSLIASKEKFNGLKPDGIVPFKFGKQKAVEIFKEKIKNKMFVSKSFKESISTEHIHGYYFPAFSFDVDCKTYYNGKLYTTETVKDKNGFSETVKKYFDIHGTKITTHKNIMIEACEKLSQYHLDSIKPYNLQAIQKFSDEYVFGYGMEFYNNSVESAYNQAQKVIQQNVEKEILSDYTYKGVENFNTSIEYINPKFSYLMLPLYRINYSHNNKQYSNIMNGQTGKLVGDYPKSAIKISLFAMLILLIVLIPAIAIILAVL